MNKASLESMCGRRSSKKLVPESHTHPENQIRSSMIGFTEIKDNVNAELMLLRCVWHYMYARMLEPRATQHRCTCHT